MSDDKDTMEWLARTLYQQHHKVLEFIAKHGSTTTFTLALAHVFGDGPDDEEVGASEVQGLVRLSNSGNWVALMPRWWQEALSGEGVKWPGCEKWWAGSLPVGCWLQLSADANGKEGNLRLVAEVGPLTDHQQRGALIRTIEETASLLGKGDINFQKLASSAGRKLSRLHTRKRLEIEDVQDSEEIAKGMKVLLKTFKPVAEAIAPALCGLVQQSEVRVA